MVIVACSNTTDTKLLTKESYTFDLSESEIYVQSFGMSNSQIISFHAPKAITLNVNVYRLGSRQKLEKYWWWSCLMTE